MGGATITGRTARGGALAGMILLVAGTAPAQEEGGLRMVFGVDSTLRADDNFDLDVDPEGDTVLWDTRLSFGLISQTRMSRLAVNLGSTLRMADFPDGTDSGFEAPSARLSYSREGARSRISMDANWQNADIRFLSPFDDQVLILDEETGEPLLVSDPGSRERIDFGLRYETGIDAPLGLVLTARHNELNYSDTLDNDYYDRETDTFSAQLRLRFSPVTTGFVTASQTNYSDDDTDQTDRETRRIGVSLAHDIDPATQVRASLGTVRIDKTETVGGGVRVNDVDEGLDASLALSRDLTNGSARLSYTHSAGATGDRDTLRVGRAMDLPRGTLSFNIGASQGDSGNTALVADIAYTQTLVRDSFNLSLARAVTGDDDDVLTTRLRAGWDHEIGELSSLSLDLAYTHVEDGGAGDTTERERANLQLAYNRALTEDWRLSAGYEHRLYDTENQPEARSNGVFVTLKRSFSIRP